MIKTITIDTFTAFQKHDVLESFEKGSKNAHDEWKDRGTDIVLFVRELQKIGFTCIGLLGHEGTGKM